MTECEKMEGEGYEMEYETQKETGSLMLWNQQRTINPLS